MQRFTEALRIITRVGSSGSSNDAVDIELSTAPNQKRSSAVLLSGGTLVNLILIWPAIFVPICFLLFYTVHLEFALSLEGVGALPFLSTTGSLVPGSMIFTYGLHLEAALLATFFLFLHGAMKERIDVVFPKNIESAMVPITTDGNDDGNSGRTGRCREMCYILCWGICMGRVYKTRRYMIKWNNILLGMGITSAYLMSITGSVPISEDLRAQDAVHGLAAFFMFFTAVLHMFCSYFTIIESLRPTSRQMWIHRISLLVCIPLNVIMTVIAGIVSNNCGTFSCRKYVFNTGPVLQYCTVLALMAYIYRFKDDISHVSLEKVVRNVEEMLQGVDGADANRGDVDRRDSEGGQDGTSGEETAANRHESNEEKVDQALEPPECRSMEEV